MDMDANADLDSQELTAKPILTIVLPILAKMEVGYEFFAQILFVVFPIRLKVLLSHVKYGVFQIDVLQRTTPDSKC